MGNHKKSEDIMMSIAAFIVNKRKAFLVLFAVACIYSVLNISRVTVINELTDYLPDDTETRQGLDIMDEEFTTFGSAKILISNITYEKALEKARELEEIDGISQVKFYDWENEDDYEDEELTDYYKDASALYSLTFEEEEETERSQKAIAEVRKRIDGYQSWVYTTVDKDDSANLRKDMRSILIIVVIVILLVLLFTSKTYMEILIFLMTFGVAALLNMGTNHLFGTISYITNAVATVLQLALAIDYAIIFFHRFMEEHEKLPSEEAVTVALSKAIPEISSSSLTTIAGMVALMLMQFGIGMDMGRVLTKAIAFSLITVFLLMPALITMMARAIDGTRHRSFVPKISLWGKFVTAIRFVGIPAYLVIVVAGCIFSNQCQYIYDVNSIQAAKMNEYLTAKRRIEESFVLDNTMAMVIPKGDYQKEGRIIEELEELDAVDTVLGLANIEVDDDGKYILVDELSPREFAEVADVDLDLVRLLYRLYAIDKKQYGAFIKSLDEYRIPIIQMIDFIYEEKEQGAIDLDEDLSDDIDDLYDAVCDAREQLEGENYSRIVFTMEGPVEGEETFAQVDRIREIGQKYYNEVYVVGDSTSDYDLSKSFRTDNVRISVMTALFVGLILLFTFQSAGLPILLVLVIQSSIWLNFSIPTLRGSSMFFLSYLVVSAIQMGATIDYAIVITSRYLELRKKIPDRKQVVTEALNLAFPTIITSGTILTVAGFIVGQQTSNATIASLGKTLGTGTLISIILVMTVLPQLLLMFDSLIDKTELGRGRKKIQEETAVTFVKLEQEDEEGGAQE